MPHLIAAIFVFLFISTAESQPGPRHLEEVVYDTGRNLLSARETKEAFKVFKMNYDKFPNVYTTNIGMGRAHSALAEYKKALTYIKAALPQAPDDGSKTRTEAMIKKLEEGKDINE